MFISKAVQYRIVIVALIASLFGFNYALAAPSVTTGTAVLSSQYLVNLYGTVNPNGSHTEVWVEYGTSSSPNTPYGRYSIGNGNSTMDVKIWVPRLQENTTYYYRMVAQSGGVATYGSVKSFNTGDGATSSTGGSSNTSNTGGTINNGNTSTYGSNTAGPTAPLAQTNGPVSVSATSAVLNGTINPNNADTRFWFEFGLTNSFGKKTSVEQAGSGNSWQLVTGNLSGLESNRTYYYRVVAQNNFGTALGDTMNFTTTNGGSGTVSSNSQSNGQVLGTVTTNSGGSGAGSGSSPSSGSSAIVSTGTGDSNPRPSFISLEYSLADDGALVHVADNVRPGPGDDFTYTVVYKNETAYSFNDSKLKVIIPSDAYYVSSNIEPLQISGTIVEFDLKNIRSGDQGEIIVVSKIREGIASETNLIFTSVLTYKDRLGVQLATTSYLTVKTGRDGTALSASIFGTIFGSSGMYLLIALGLLIFMSILTYVFVKIRKNGTVSRNKKDEFGLDSIPATFEPVGPVKK